MCPAVALEAGFYCIDGYSNNYSLEYKHEFRGIIEEELEKCPAMKGYFDDWGSRCYLFTEESQNYYYLAKEAGYEPEAISGFVDRSMRPHSWVEITGSDGEIRIYDTVFSRSRRAIIFGRTYTEAPYIYTKATN